MSRSTPNSIKTLRVAHFAPQMFSATQAISHFGHALGVVVTQSTYRRWSHVWTAAWRAAALLCAKIHHRTKQFAMDAPLVPEGIRGHKRKRRPGREHSIRTSGKPGYGRNLADGVWKPPSFKPGPQNCWNTRITGFKSASRKGIFLKNLPS